MKKVAVFGSTGSIGRQTLEVIASHSDELQLVCIAASTNADLLLQQAKVFDVNDVILSRGDANLYPNIRCGHSALEDYAQEGDYDILLVAVTGLDGLKPTIAAIRRGKRVALANKESLVLGGKFVLDALKEGGELLPVDSEHAAIHQCLASGRQIDSLLLTCSGGALRDYPLEKLDRVTLPDVMRHPTWDMGIKITIDCATMVNKALEVAEAHYLFGVPFDRIEVVMHPESIVHSMVRFADGAVLAQMAKPDMRLPIQYALLYPYAARSLVERLDFARLTLHFDPHDPVRYPSFGLGVNCLSIGGAKAAAFVAADQVATQAFADGSIGYKEIHTIIENTVSRFDGEIDSIDELERIYIEALDLAGGLIK